jgi:2Fe-2S ferredoxin
MTKVAIISRDGSECFIEALNGHSLMNAIRDESSDLLALCGGACSCATCHVYVDQTWIDSLPPMSEAEDALLDGSEFRRPESRLSCQIVIDDSHEGLRAEIAPEE